LARASESASSSESAAALCAAADRFVTRVAHWQPSRWSRPAAHPIGGDETTRASAVFSLVQRIADLAATAEGCPARAVPRLDNDLALPDQLRVMVADLLLAGPPERTLREAAEWIAATSRAL
jgi:hypothetical protein